MDLAIVLMSVSKVPDAKTLDVFHRRTLSKLRNLCDTIYQIGGEPSDGVLPLSITTSKEFFTWAAKTLPGKQILIINAYSPLLDIASTREMLAEHEKLAFDYTYPENLPFGLLPEVLSADVAESIADTIPNDLPLFEKNAHEAFHADLSSYDTNIFVSPCRLMKHRVNFVPDNLNDAMVIQSIIDAKADNMSLLELEVYLGEHPELLRLRPTFYEVELTTERSMYGSPTINRDGVMDVALVKTILDEASRFSGASAICFGLFGDPFLHPRIDEITSLIKNYPDMRFIFDSPGIAINFAPIQALLELPNVEVIIDVSFVNVENFAKHKRPNNDLLPFEGLSALEAKIKALTPKERVYPQFTRTPDNELELMKFFEVWQDYSERVIVRKPDVYCGEMEHLRVVDLSPVHRYACLHLKHDLVFHIDGTVPLCRQDYNANHAAGNIKVDSIETIWANLDPAYKAQWSGDYNTPACCGKCDEWWVFNL